MQRCGDGERKVLDVVCRTGVFLGLQFEGDSFQGESTGALVGEKLSGVYHRQSFRGIHCEFAGAGP